MIINLHEKESFVKSFGLFFVVIEIFLAFIFYNYYKVEEEHLSEYLFLEMKNYSFFFEDRRFDMDIVPRAENDQFYELYFDEKHLYILTPLPEDDNSSLAIFYPIEEYQSLLGDIKHDILLQALFLSFIAWIISLIFSIYTLSPLRDSLRLLEEFIKDIIHDLNTPITSILINLKMMEKNEEVESIAQSANTIAMLHKNLDVYLRDSKFEQEKFSLKELLEEQIEFFKPLYNYLEWQIELEDMIILSNPNAFSRIIYNLLSNACKYNTSMGFVKIVSKRNILSISNESYGIKEPSKVFERFYKESDRGLGIGLHIVEKLCNELDITKKLEVDKHVVTITLILH